MKNWMMQVVITPLLLGMGAVVVMIGIASAEIKLGTVPRLSAAELQTMYAPLAEYLSKETGEKVSIIIPKDFQAFKEAAKAGQIDIGFANPLIYVEIKDKVNIEPLALSSEVKSGTRLRGIIIVRKDSGIERITDLKGKKFVFMDKDSPAGYLFQLLLLNKAGFDTKKDITVLPFAKRHDKVVQSVFDRTADAGGIREDELEKVKDKVDISQIRIVGYTDYFPNWPFFATPKLKSDTASKIKAALLKLKPNDPKNEAILGPARLTGFIPIADREYDELRKATKISGSM
ncbi:MAG TPA: phosphate/phosphite/phosphonate ABC transporter substrate-binding protein [Nitrospirota bacterium]|nr:phosphate/phosphite/phosphonate ABC transporter substrate-binding protein [Nitrospirota bacterium]